MLMILSVIIACKKKEETTVTETESETTTVATYTMSAAEANSDMVYACPMHPEVTGAKGEKCPKCGMALAEEVSP